MISVAVPSRAARLTVLVLLAAAARAALVPLGEPLSTAVFAASLGGVLLVEARPGGERRWPMGRSLVAGGVIGLLLVAPVVAQTLAAGVKPGVAAWAGPVAGSERALGDFWVWGAIAAAIASLEEIVIRGWLQPSWTAERGPVAGVVIASIVFALIHLPRYGLGAMPLDFSVGLALGGLRLVTGRVLPCAVAHVIADWGAWFFA